MRSTLRRDFLNEIEADRAHRRLDQFAQMLARTWLLAGLADLQHVFRASSTLQLELLPRPSRHDAYRGGGRKTMALRTAVEIHLNRHTFALVNVDVTMPVKFQDFNGQGNVDRLMPIFAVLDLVTFG